MLHYEVPSFSVIVSSCCGSSTKRVKMRNRACWVTESFNICFLCWENWPGNEQEQTHHSSNLGNATKGTRSVTRQHLTRKNRHTSTTGNLIAWKRSCCYLPCKQNTQLNTAPQERPSETAGSREVGATNKFLVFLFLQQIQHPLFKI